MTDQNPTRTDNELSFLETPNGPKLHVKDVLFIVLRNLHWLVICGLLGAGIAGYIVRHQNRIYESNARVLIKSSSTGSDSAENTVTKNTQNKKNNSSGKKNKGGNGSKNDYMGKKK